MTMQFFDLMLDLETLGTQPDAAIVSIGACFFDIKSRAIGPTFNRTIHLSSAVKHGGTMDPSTVLWWLRQGDAARKAIAYNGEPIDRALSDFVAWCMQHCRAEDLRPWGNGSSFDITIMETALRRLGIELPWKFWNIRCFRTVKSQYPQVKYDVTEKGDEAHNALADAKFQCQHLFKIADHLAGKKAVQ
jgi:hypothetical protein